MSNLRKHLPHIVVKGSAKSEKYTSPNQFPRSRYPERNRTEHAAFLLAKIKSIYGQKEQERGFMPKGAVAPGGIYIEFEGKPGFDLALKSLDLPSKGIELLNVKKIQENDEERIVATVFIPDEKITIFIKKIEQYRDEETKKGKPKNNTLVASIDDVKLAVIKSLWTDTDDCFPSSQDFIWWEVWLRDTPDNIRLFEDFAKVRDMTVSQRRVKFPDRCVVCIYATVKKISELMCSFGFIAELRRAKETTGEFLEMKNYDQREWVDSLLSRVDAPDNNAPAVCVFDSGITKQHPLIDQFLQQDKLHACDPGWGTSDHAGHGTAMAGLILYNDLNAVLLGNERVEVPCHLESVKILPPVGENRPDLYGHIIEEAISRVTIKDTHKERIICMAITSIDGRDEGQPSSWSATLDKICVGQTIEGKKHLAIISAGNVNQDNHIDYPHSNKKESIHDPGQSWNALTIGAYTNKAIITESGYEGWTPLAQVGDMAPANTTSLIWQQNKWPIKPDIVFEGGNAARDPTGKIIDHPESLALLSTNKAPFSKMFTWIADTSSAAALAAHMAAVIHKTYPQFWPETSRGLMVHSADWTNQMRKTYPVSNKAERELLLRSCGYGVPNLDLAISSASNSLTMIAQDELKPYDKNSMHELNLHSLPWPKDILESLGETPVKMRITLSYFVEPNPGRRGWEHKFRYQSHGLRFDVKTSEETAQEFIMRINKERWDEEQGRSSVTSTSNASGWFFGERIRSKGSLHSDIWEGTAASLAARNQIAVFPVTGWWREMHSKGHTAKKARYSLIVTISTPETTIDIYTPVETIISSQVSVET